MIRMSDLPNAISVLQSNRSTWDIALELEQIWAKYHNIESDRESDRLTVPIMPTLEIKLHE